VREQGGPEKRGRFLLSISAPLLQKGVGHLRCEGRKLSFDDLFHYQKIVVALKETMRLMGEIEELIPAWPIE